MNRFFKSVQKIQVSLKYFLNRFLKNTQI